MMLAATFAGFNQKKANETTKLQVKIYLENMIYFKEPNPVPIASLY